MDMNDLNMGVNNAPMQREAQELNKYGRAPQPEMAAQAHFYTKHSIEPAYGQFGEPTQEENG